MKRREFIAALGGAAAWPLVARAQQTERVRRIGVMHSSPPVIWQPREEAFKEALAELGWIEGRNLRIDYRPVSSDPDRLRAAVSELVALAPEVIVATTTSLPTLQAATRTIPVVFTRALDPVALGYVASLAKPGGNMTGHAGFDPLVAPKWVQLLKEIAPLVTHAGLLYDPINAGMEQFAELVSSAAPALGVQITSTAVRNAVEIERAIGTVALTPNSGMILPANPSINVNLDLAVALTTQHRLPTIGVWRFFAERGGLASYGPLDLEPDRLAASYVDRILKGAKPAELPVQYSTKYELVINLKTAKTLGLSIPSGVMAIADQVIE
jgi:putative ABC transport system substrate-binding protein